MIKWGSYWKLLKQSFIILLISCFTLLVNSFVNAFECDWLTNCYDLDFWEYISGNSWQYAWTVSDNAFNFSSKYFSYTTLRNNNLENKLNYWWESDWLHYTRKYWNESSPVNWKVVGFYVCSQRPYMQTAYRTLSSASFCTYKPSFLELSTYLNWVNKYSISCNSSNTYTNCMVCLYEYWAWNYICVDDWDTSNNESEFKGVSQIESVATDNPFVSTTPYTPPSMSWTWNVIPWQMTWDYLVNKCTYWEILDYLQDAWYSKYLCYWGLDNFDLYDSSLNYNPIPWTWKTLQEIVSYSSAWDTPYQWFAYWDWLRGWYTAMRESYPAVYKTRFDFYYTYWQWVFYFPTVLEYCNILQLDIDYASTVYNWQYFKTTCTDIIKNPWNSDEHWSAWVNLDWIGGKTGYTTYVNWDTFIQDYFNLLKEKFPTKYDLWLWFLPWYIIFFLLALVFFRFLAH